MAGSILDTYHNDDVAIYALFDKFSPSARASVLKNKPVRTTILQHVPFISRFYRYFLPFMPWLMGRFRLRGYDLIISTSHAVAKGFKSDPGTLNICYCHTPLRPIWDMYDDYAASHPMGHSFFYRKFVEWLRRWDVRSAGRVHYFIANSKHIQQRILRSYGRESVVIYPPIRVAKFVLNTAPREEYYLCPGRFVPYKKIDMVVRAFRRMPGKKLVLIGDGWGAQQVHELIDCAPNIEWLGYRDDATLIQYIQQAKACIFAAKEDFGIMCVEVQACGTPVLALDYGGYRETVADGQTGYLFTEQTEESLMAAVEKMEQSPLQDHGAIRAHAMAFSEERFHREFTAFVAQAQKQFYRK